MDINYYGKPLVSEHAGPTSARPSAAAVTPGFMFFDLTLKKPVWSDGSIWVDATGTAA